MLNVKDFGTIGNGITDDQPPLQDAFNAVGPSGDVIYVPPGIYVVGATLALKSKTYIQGAGRATVFKRKSDPAPSASSAQGEKPVVNVFLSDTVTDVTVEAISIDINGASPIPPDNDSWATGIGFNQCSNIRIRDTRIFDSTTLDGCCRMGILVKQSDHVWIERNYLTHGLRIVCGNCDGVIVENNIVEDANDNAISIAQVIR